MIILPCFLELRFARVFIFMDFIEVARVELLKDELAVPSNSVIKHMFLYLLMHYAVANNFLVNSKTRRFFERSI